MNVPMRRRGAAMLIVACVLAVVVMLSLSLLFAVSRLTASAATKRDDEQSRILAVSLSKELERQLTQPTDAEMEPGSDSLWRYIRDNVWTDAWPYFNEDESAHSQSRAWRSYAVPASAAADAVELALYWESDQDTYRAGKADGALLVARVRCDVAGQESVITSEFALTVVPVTEGDSSQWHDDWFWSLTGRE